jgi:hypothetical protein
LRPVLLRYSAVQSDEKKKARTLPRLLADVDPHVGAGLLALLEIIRYDAI